MEPQKTPAWRSRRALLILLGVVLIPLWQLSLFRTDYSEKYNFKAFGIKGEAHFVYFLYYLNLFPVASTMGGRDQEFYFTTPNFDKPEPSTLEYSPAAAQRVLEQQGSTLVTAWGESGRDGEFLQAYLFLPDAWRLALFHPNDRLGSPQFADVRFANSVMFVAGLIALYVSFTLIGQTLLGSTLVLFIGSNPFQLYETYTRDNVFSWIITTFCWVLAFTTPFMIKRSLPHLVYWCAAGVVGLFCATVSYIRPEPTLVLFGVVAVYLTSPALTWRRRLAVLLILGASYQVGMRSWSSYFHHKIDEATAVVAKAGGNPLLEPRLEFHSKWDTLWLGLGDFDTKYGYEWTHRASDPYAQPILREKYGEELPYWFAYDLGRERNASDYYDAAQVYFKRPLDLPHYQEVLRNKMLYDILHDPIWYFTILSKRAWTILTKMTPIELRVGQAVLSAPFTGLLVVPLLIFLYVKRQTFALHVIALGATTSLTAFFLHAGRRFYYPGVYHYCAVAIVVALLVERGISMVRNQTRRDTVTLP